MQTQAVAKLTSKCQATVPEPIRKVLGLEPGDSVAFVVVSAKKGEVLVRKATRIDLEFARAIEGTLATEWLSKHDDQAYRDL
ncbi:MAG: type II toxin-antitoxin system PrlF family antitoxin [Nitrospirae bacterium]|nr:type II toxin-antitoxin system PrlF family antitoxin [Nitrospirota bacterium]